MATLTTQDWDSGIRSAAELIGSIAALIGAIAKLLEALAKLRKAAALAAGSKPGPVVRLITSLAGNAYELIALGLGLVFSAFLPSLMPMLVVVVVFVLLQFRHLTTS